jgi:hypothetical protein
VYFEPLEDLGFAFDFDFEELVVGFFDDVLLATVFGLLLLVELVEGFEPPPKAYGSGGGGGASAVTGGVW